MNSESRICVAGWGTMIGAALVRELHTQGHGMVVGLEAPEPDWGQEAEVEQFFREHHPDFAFHAAGPSGGIRFNQRRPAHLMTSNLRINLNLLEACHRHGVAKAVYIASSCCYPRDCPQPMTVDSLGSGPLEPTNEAYATAKLAGLVLARAYGQEFGCRFVTVLPANVFGPGDDYDPEDSHVIGALLHRMHEAKRLGHTRITLWGTGTPRRDFLYVDDLARACILVMRTYEGPLPINVGSGRDQSIQDLASMIRDVVGYGGELHFDPTAPDGMPRKCLDAGPMEDLGWTPMTPMVEALRRTYEDFLAWLDARS